MSDFSSSPRRKLYQLIFKYYQLNFSRSFFQFVKTKCSAVEKYPLLYSGNVWANKTSCAARKSFVLFSSFTFYHSNVTTRVSSTAVARIRDENLSPDRSKRDVKKTMYIVENWESALSCIDRFQCSWFCTRLLIEKQSDRKYLHRPTDHLKSKIWVFWLDICVATLDRIVFYEFFDCALGKRIQNWITDADNSSKVFEKSLNLYHVLGWSCIRGVQPKHSQWSNPFQTRSDRSSHFKQQEASDR